jgi:hypothetical protein
MLAIEIAAFGFAWWLGLYLLRSSEAAPAARWTAGGLISYAVALALNALGQIAPESLGYILRWQVPLLLAPLLFWIGAIWTLRHKLRTVPARLKSAQNPQTAVGLILIATISFALGLGLILVPLDWLPRNWLIVAIGGDLLILGYAVGVLDAFEQGESLLPDFVRSFVEAEIIAWLLGLQVGAVMWLATGVTFPMVTLLFVVVATGIALQVFASYVQRWLDGLVFGRFPQLSQERAALRELVDALPRTQTVDAKWTEEEFVKLTRNALSHLGDLPRLASSPLNRLALIDERLRQSGLDDNTLARTAELKALLIESIGKLKPSDTIDFDTTQAWRHYNALYFPYVRGLRPYSRGSGHYDLNPTDKKALDWLQVEIPPRTLYNWQAAATKLIAADLREQMDS